MIRPALPILLAALAVPALAACGEKDGDDLGAGASASVTLVLDYLPNADHVGIYTAQARGEFAKAGLRVKIADAPPTPRRR